MYLCSVRWELCVHMEVMLCVPHSDVFITPIFGLCLKSLSPLFFFYFGRKVKSSMDTNSKKQLNFLRLSMGFDRKKIKIWVLTEQMEDWCLWRSTRNLCTAFLFKFFFLNVIIFLFFFCLNLFIIRLVSSDQTGFIRDSNKMAKGN